MKEMVSTVCMLVIVILAVIFMYNHVIHPMLTTGKTLFFNLYPKSTVRSPEEEENGSNATQREESSSASVYETLKPASRFMPTAYRYNNDFIEFSTTQNVDNSYYYQNLPYAWETAPLTNGTQMMYNYSHEEYYSNPYGDSYLWWNDDYGPASNGVWW